MALTSYERSFIDNFNCSMEPPSKNASAPEAEHTSLNPTSVYFLTLECWCDKFEIKASMVALKYDPTFLSQATASFPANKATFIFISGLPSMAPFDNIEQSGPACGTNWWGSYSRHTSKSSISYTLTSSAIINQTK